MLLDEEAKKAVKKEYYESLLCFELKSNTEDL